MKTHVYHDCLAKKWLLASGGHLAWRHESNTPICKRICGLCSQLTHGGIEICHRRTRRFTIKSAHGPHCTHTPYIPQSRPVLTTEESAPFGRTFCWCRFHFSCISDSCTCVPSFHFTRRALPVECLSRIALVHCPHIARTDAAHRLHTSQVIEQLVQVVVLSCMRRLRLSLQRLAHQANN